MTKKFGVRTNVCSFSSALLGDKVSVKVQTFMGKSREEIAASLLAGLPSDHKFFEEKEVEGKIVTAEVTDAKKIVVLRKAFAQENTMRIFHRLENMVTGCAALLSSLQNTGYPKLLKEVGKELENNSSLFEAVEASDASIMFGRTNAGKIEWLAAADFRGILDFVSSLSDAKEEIVEEIEVEEHEISFG